MVNEVKSFYDKYDFIDPKEDFFTHESHDKDAYLPHKHAFFELIFIVSGKGLHFINDKSYVVYHGDVFFLLPDEVHSFVPLDENHHMTWQSCIWLDNFFPVSEPLGHTHRYSGMYHSEIAAIFTSIQREFKEKKEGYLDVIRSYLHILFTKMNRVTTNSAGQSYASTRKDNLIKQAVQYLSTNYHKDILLQDVADDLNISSVYLCKLFKKHMGQGVIQFLNSIRLEKSYTLLMETDLTVQEIAQQIGFFDVKCFYSQFKNRMGITPGEFRNNSGKAV